MKAPSATIVVKLYGLGVGGGGYDACGSRMESIKLSAASVLWKKIQFDFFRALNNKGANPRRTQVFCCCCIYIFKKKTTLTQCPVSLSRMFLSPGNMHNENKARRITTHVTRTPSIYVYNILRENSDEWIFGVHPPFLILLQMNN